MSASSTPAAPLWPVPAPRRGAAASCGPFTAIPTAAPRQLLASHASLRRGRRRLVPVHVALLVAAVADQDRRAAAQHARMPRLAPHHIAEAGDQRDDEDVRREVERPG